MERERRRNMTRATEVENEKKRKAIVLLFFLALVSGALYFVFLVKGCAA
jgi:hypothetical protein